MTVDLVVELANKALYTVILTSAPVLIVSLVIGPHRQHFSDRYVNPGADTYVCTEDRCGFCNADDLRTLDAEPDDKSHSGYVVGLFCIYQVMDHDRV